MKPLTILLADDHPLFRKGLISIIKMTAFHTSKILEASDGKEAVDIARSEPPDIAFLDVNMPHLNGYEAAKTILFTMPHLPIVVLTQFDEIPLILNFFKLGVKGFLTKNIEPEEISDAISFLLKGDYYYHSRFDKEISKWLSSGLHKKIPAIKFSEREMQLLVLLSKGKTTKEISEELELSFRSVETYRYNLLRKANVKNTVELISYIYKNCIL